MILQYLQRSTISNHDIHRYADLRNAGIVRNAEEFHDLHPFVRAHAGRSSAYIIGFGASGGQTNVTEHGTMKVNTREEALAMSAWLKGTSSYQR